MQTQAESPAFDTHLLRGLGFLGRAPTGLGAGITLLATRPPPCTWGEIYPTASVSSGLTAAELNALVTTISNAMTNPSLSGATIDSAGVMYFDYLSNGTTHMRSYIRSSDSQLVIAMCTGPAQPASPPAQPSGPVSAPGPSTITWIGYAWVVGGDPSTPPAALPPGVTALPSGVLGNWVWRPAMRTQSGVIQAWCWYPPGGVLTQLGPSGASVYVVAFPGQVGNATTSAPTSPPVPGASGQWIQTHAAYFAWKDSSTAATTPPAVPAAPLAPATDYTWLYVGLGVVIVGVGAYLALD
jgi:hypothetical protein